jgi:L-lactate dehydrogenase
MNKHTDHNLPSFEEMDEYVRKIGIKIFADKGNTSYGIASSLAMITQAILRDSNRILPVSVLLKGEYNVEGIYIGAPVILTRTGIREVVEIDLSEEEKAKYLASAEILHKNVALLEK